MPYRIKDNLREIIGDRPRFLVANKRGSVPVCDICPTGISVGHAPLHGRFRLGGQNDKLTGVGMIYI